MGYVPPWEVDGLPEGISPTDFNQAGAYYISGIFRFGKRLIPVNSNRNGWYFNLSGTGYKENANRLTELLQFSPMYEEEYRGQIRRYYPAILLPDPSNASDGPPARPVAVCGCTGYVGSAWQEAATELRPEVDSARAEGRYMFTRLRLEEDSRRSGTSGFRPTIWLPCEPFS